MQEFSKEEWEGVAWGGRRKIRSDVFESNEKSGVMFLSLMMAESALTLS